MTYSPQIYFLDGTCATGKTTLIKYYQKQYGLQLTIVSEVAREIFTKYNIPPSKHHTLATQKLIQQGFISSIAQAKLRGKKVLADASPYSCIGYAALFSQENADVLLSNVKDFETGNKFFIIPDPNDVQYIFNPNDSVRTETEEERKKVQETLVQMYNRLQFPYQLVSGTVEERVKKINKILFK